MKECTGHEKINMDQKETKKMKSVYKVCLLVLAMLPAAFSLGAQPKGERKDPEFWKKVQAEKVEFITKRMGLQKDESEAFLKAYNEYEEQKGRLFHERQEALRSLKKALKSKKNVQTLLKKYLEARANLDAWEMSDYGKFSEVLTDERIARQGSLSLRKTFAGNRFTGSTVSAGVGRECLHLTEWVHEAG